MSALPVALDDGRSTVALRILSHRARRNLTRLVPDLDNWCSMRDGHVFLMASDDLDAALDAMPRYCRGSIRPLKRLPSGDGWGRAWRSVTT
jgi:hypothetical protein